jgi:hypothetical protein
MHRFSLAASASFVALFGAATPAGAAAFVSFVSGSGTDTGDCGTPATVCRQITYALTQTNEGGIIHVLPGEYNAFPVSTSVEIVADAGQASIFSTVTAGDTGIAVNVSGAQAVRLRGFLISAAHGILINGSGGTVHIENCTLLGAENHSGIVYAPTGASELYVSDTAINGSGAPNVGGILIKPTGSGSAKAVLDNVKVEDNATGITVDGSATTGANIVTIRNSVVSGSSGNGVRANDSGGGSTNVSLEQSSASNNATNGVAAIGANATVRLSNSTVTGNARGLNTGSGGKIISHGGNLVSGNTVDGAFTSTVAPK